MTLILLKNKLRSLRNMGAKLSTGQKITAVLFHVIITGFALFLGVFFAVAFFALKESTAGILAVMYLLDHLFFLIFALAVASGAISSLYSMFKAHEIDYLVSLPLRPRAIFDYLLVQNMILNIWPVVIVGLPLVIAFTAVFKTGIFIGVAMVLGLLPLTVVAEALGALIAIAGARLFQQFRGPLTVGIVIILGVGFAYYLANVIAPAQLESLINEDAVLTGTRFIENPYISQVYLPNYWLSLAYKSGLEGDNIGALIAVSTLFVGTGFVVTLVRFFGGAVYIGIWMRSRQTPRRTRRTKRRGFPRFASGVNGALIERDYLSFSRSGNEILQAFFFFILVLILVFTVSRYPRFDTASGIWPYWAAMLLFGAITYYLAMLANRFVFPSLSLEGRSFWILLSSPLRLGEIWHAKLIYSAAVLAALGVALTSISAYFFRAPYLLVAAMLLWVAIAGVVIAAISLAVGTLYPDFTRQSPAELSSSLAGLAATVASLIYGALAMALFSPIAAAFYLEATYPIALSLLANLILSGVILAYLRHISLKKLAGFHL